MTLRRAVIAMMAGTGMMLVPVAARAQTPGQLAVTAARRDTMALDSSAAVTAVFRVKNTSRDTVIVTPSLSLPRGWEPLMRPATMRIAPGATELWIAGVHAPGNATAGVATIRGSAGPFTDSVFVRVDERRAIEVLPLEAPGWIVSGGTYEARFLVRNRGNVTASVALTATSSRGTRCTVDIPVVSLAPGATSNVRVRIAESGVGGHAQDDLIELAAQDQHDSRVRVAAMSRTTLIPKNGAADNLATIPAMLTLRAAPGGYGVSPASIAGHGKLGTTNTTIDFAAHAPASGQSPFGEREDYRLGIRSGDFSARLGDGMYGLSQLTSTGGLGFGGEFDATRGALSTGLYVQRSRWTPNAPVEAGAYLGSPRDASSRIGLVAVGRTATGAPTGIFGVDAAMPLGRTASLAMEVAASDSNGSLNGAERGHLSGMLGRVSYDLTHQWSGLSYAGSQRGTQGSDVSLSAPASRALSFHAYAGQHNSGPSAPSATAPRDEFGSGSIGATYGSWGSVDYVWSTRHDVADTLMFDGMQRGIRATSFVPLGPLSVSLNLDRGTSAEHVNPAAHDYLGFGGSLNMQLPLGGSMSVFAQHSDGNTLGSDGRGSLTAGLFAGVALSPNVRLTVTSSVSSMERLASEATATTYGQADARLEYRLPSETTIGLRGHLWINPALQGARDGNIVYVEVKKPLGIPIGRQRRLGRVEGRVSDANGKPVSGVLVHVGDQVAVTDARGQVSLFGLASGVHPVSLDAAGAAAQSMLVGDASVTVDGNSPRPASFSVGMARGARLRGRVKVLDFGSSVPESADSLVDAGTLQNVTVSLQGSRDTLYQTTDDRGQIDFGAIPPGRWTLAVLPGATLPDHHAFQNERIDLQLVPGDQREVELRVVPRKRTITFIGTGETLKIRDPK